MGQLSRYLRSVSMPEGKGIAYFCPGCGHMQYIPTEGEHPVWTWDGNVEAPTLNPSILTWRDVPEKGIHFRCHSFVRGGNIEFLGDCTHALAGKTVPLPELPEGYRDND